MRHIIFFLVLASAALAGCGGDDAERTASPVDTPSPTATVTSTATATPSPEETVTLPVQTPTPTATAEGEGGEEGGGGDEEAIAVPIKLSIDGEGIKPAEVKVAPTLPFELIVENGLPGRMSIEIHGQNVAFVVEGGQTYRQRVGGLPRGTYEIEAGHLGVTTLKVG